MAMNSKLMVESTTKTITQSDGNTKPALETLKGTGGAALVLSDPVMGDILADKLVKTTSRREALPSGGTLLEVYNTDASNFMRFEFGDDEAEATVSRGFYVGPGERVVRPIPPEATYWANIADTADLTASVIVG